MVVITRWRTTKLAVVITIERSMDVVVREGEGEGEDENENEDEDGI